jgi:hypothetical protein
MGNIGIQGGTRTQTVIDYPHYELHAGKFYYVASISPELDTASYYWKITTPNSAVRAHFTLALSCNVLTNGYLYENPTVNVAGAAQASFNGNRNSANVATVTWTKGDTSTADGTLLWAATFGGSGGGGAKTGGDAGTRQEIILKANEEYFIKVTTLANDGIVNLSAGWYED